MRALFQLVYARNCFFVRQIGLRSLLIFLTDLSSPVPLPLSTPLTFFGRNPLFLAFQFLPSPSQLFPLLPSGSLRSFVPTATSEARSPAPPILLPSFRCPPAREFRAGPFKSGPGAASWRSDVTGGLGSRTFAKAWPAFILTANGIVTDRSSLQCAEGEGARKGKERKGKEGKGGSRVSPRMHAATASNSAGFFNPVLSVTMPARKTMPAQGIMRCARAHREGRSVCSPEKSAQGGRPTGADPTAQLGNNAQVLGAPLSRAKTRKKEAGGKARGMGKGEEGRREVGAKGRCPRRSL